LPKILHRQYGTLFALLLKEDEMRIVLSLFALLATITSAGAIDFNQTFAQLDGSPILGSDGKPSDAKLYIVAENALLASYEDEKALSGEEKLKRYMLAQKIEIDARNSKPDTELTADEIALLKRLVAKAYGPLIVGQAWKMIDPAEGKK
jgi:hypothetical protein